MIIAIRGANKRWHDWERHSQHTKKVVLRRAADRESTLLLGRRDYVLGCRWSIKLSK